MIDIMTTLMTLAQAATEATQATNVITEHLGNLIPELILLAGGVLCLMTGLGREEGTRKATAWIAGASLLLAIIFIPNIQNAEVKEAFRTALTIFRGHERHAEQMVEQVVETP